MHPDSKYMIARIYQVWNLYTDAHSLPISSSELFSVGMRPVIKRHGLSKHVKN